MDAVDASRALGHDDRLERPLAVPEDHDLRGPDLAQRDLHPERVSYPPTYRHATVLVSRVPDRHCPQNVLRELIQQPRGPTRLTPCAFPGANSRPTSSLRSVTCPATGTITAAYTVQAVADTAMPPRTKLNPRTAIEPLLAFQASLRVS